MALNLPIAASGQGSQVEGILKHTNGYLTVYPYNASYDDGSFVKAYYDGNNKRLLFMNSASGVITGLYAGRIIATDNVGIGTSNPQEKLSVNGNIRAKEVKVETANWPDYVFKEGYDLMPLAELGAHIKAHGRLPGIPSAGEVEANGIELAEMNRKLLEKVEELTLYILQQREEINQLKENRSDSK